MSRLPIVLALASLLLVTSAFAANDLSGVVLDQNGNPLPGTHVSVYTAHPRKGESSTCPSCYRDCGKRTDTGTNGAFQLSSLDATLVFDVLAVADGYEPSFVRRNDPAEGGKVTITMQPRSLADADRLITGTVVDTEGKPVVGATVEPSGYHIGRRVGYGAIPGVDQLSVTNAKGEFALRIPSAEGQLDVRVSARNLAPHIDRLLVPCVSRRITMTEGATITGHLTRDGRPAANTPIVVIQRNRASSDFLGRFETATNDDGLFVLTNVAPNIAYELKADGANVPVTTGGEKSTTDAGTLTAVVPQ